MESKDKMILMKVTSRGRPNELLHCINEHIKFADNPTQMVWLISLDYDDDKCNSVALCDSIGHLIDNPNIVFANSISKIDAINRDVNGIVEHWDILLNISDDQLPIIKGYDTIIRNSMPNDLDYSLWFSDGWQNKINTQEIIGYNYYKRSNQIYHSGFKSFFCDNLETERADKLGKQIKSTQCIIKHFHPGWCKDTHMTMDQTYNKCQKDWSHDEALYNKLKNEL